MANKTLQNLQKTNENTAKNNKNTNNLNSQSLLGELLKTMRNSSGKEHIIVLRSIKGLNILGDEVRFVASDEVLAELKQPKVLEFLEQFFKSYGLKIKFDEKTDLSTPKETLNELLGGKLKIV